MPKAEYDKQGKYFYHLWKLAGWDQQRVDRLLVKRYNTTHWNALTTQQKSAVIATMQAYAKQAELNRMKQAPGVRQNIMAIVVRNGQSADWLHDRMEEWGWGRSLRELSYSQLLSLKQSIIACFNGQKQEVK